MKPCTSIFLAFISFFIGAGWAFSQSRVSGRVLEKDAQGKELPLPMAGIKWLNTQITAVADENGKFNIAFPDSFPAKLQVSMIGYKPDTILFRDSSHASVKIILKPAAATLGTVTVVGKQQSTSNLITSEINTEKITAKELTLAACCNLSESFERNASVDVNFTDAVSGAKQIQMLGLDGIYTQILYEYLPFVRGLSSSYGLTYIPGPWVESIYVTKGTGSVVNGFESITGQIQIEMLEPYKADRVFINGYANNESRYEVNAHLAHRFNHNLSTILFAHSSTNKMSMDKNKDGFLDAPLKTQHNLFNRWHFMSKNDKLEGQFGFRFLQEDRTGGQTGEHAHDSAVVFNPYKISISTQQFETFTKNGLLFPDKPWKSMAITTTERFHRQEAQFGNRKYYGEQRSLYVNTISQGILDNTFNKVKFGVSLIADDYREKFNGDVTLQSDSVFNSKEIIPGGYGEYTFNNDSDLSVVVGLRADYFKNTAWIFNPRLHLKHNPTPESAVRLSGGRGTRTAHIFAENAAVLASSREIIIRDSLKPETAWNYGATISYCFEPWGREATLNLDFFRTDFQNQVVMDLEDAGKVQFYNLKGKSYSNSFQGEIGISPFKGFDAKLAYKYYDVQTTYNRKLLAKPYVPRHRALLNLDYATNMEKWMFNFTVKWFGESRLPNTSAKPEEFRLAEKSPPYFTLMGQVSKKFRWFELYVGAENILDYTISNPVLDPQNPFDNNFDASMIWGPVTGRVIYAGFRYKII